MEITIAQGAFLPVPPILGGAVEKVWFGLGPEFVKAGHAVTHLSRRCHGLPEREVLNGVRHLRVKGYDSPRSLPWLKFLDLRYSLRILKQLPEADILVTNTFWLPFFIRSRKKGRLYVHVARYPKGQYRFYRRAYRLQTVSTVIAEAIKKQYPPAASKVRVIPNPLPADFQVVGEEELERRGPLTLLFVGRIHPEKGLDILCAAFRRLLEKSDLACRLAIVGPHKEGQGGAGIAYLEGLKKKVADIAHGIEWVGPVFDSMQLRKHYRRAHFLVYPSIAARGEASPLTPLEAMANGCVPIVSRLKCFDDYLRPEENGYAFSLEKGSPVEELTQCLFRVSQLGEGLRPIQKACLATAANFTSEKIARLYLQDFQSLLADES